MEIETVLKEIIESGACYNVPEFVKIKESGVTCLDNYRHEAKCLFFDETCGKRYVKITIEDVQEKKESEPPFDYLVRESSFPKKVLVKDLLDLGFQLYGGEINGSSYYLDIGDIQLWFYTEDSMIRIVSGSDDGSEFGVNSDEDLKTLVRIISGK